MEAARTIIYLNGLFKKTPSRGYSTFNVKLDKELKKNDTVYVFRMYGISLERILRWKATSSHV